MSDFLDYVLQIEASFRQGATNPLTPPPAPPMPDVIPSRKALIFSPHPDDECLIGGLALRLRRELRYNIINVAVTQGSQRDRQAARYAELAAACNHLGFGLLSTGERGLERINPKGREGDPAAWKRSVDVICGILEQHQPLGIFLPHRGDWNTTHIGTHLLVTDALRALGSTLRCWAVLTEFWAALPNPNLMVESDARDVAHLINAMICHAGEVARNPYHLRQPAWMMDNVRRGAELLGGQGGAAPDMTFATLYRLERWVDGAFQPALPAGRCLTKHDSLDGLFL